MNWLQYTLAGCLVALIGAVAFSPGPAQAGPEAQDRAAADLYGDPLPAGALARLGTIRWRHGANATFVAFAPDGKTLVTAGQDNTIRLWDLATGKEIRRFLRPNPALPRPLPKKGGADQQAEIEAALQLMLRGQNTGSRWQVALSPDGKTLAAGSGNVIQLWEVDTGKELRQLQGSLNGVAGLLFSPDSRTLAARGGNDNFILWAVETGKELHQIKPPPRKAEAGVVLILGGGGDTEAPGMAFTPDSKTLAAAVTNRNQGGNTSAVKFWDVASGKETRQIKAPEGANVQGVAIAPGGKVLAYSAGNVIRLCEADTGKEVRQFKSPGGAIALVFSPDGQSLAARGGNQGVRLWELETGKELPVSFDLTGVRALAFSPDGKKAAVTAGSTVRLWEPATGKELTLPDGPQTAPHAVVLSADGKTAISWGTDRVIRRWETTSGKLLGAFPAPGTRRAALSPDGRTIALANADNTIRIHEATTGKELRRFKGPSNGTTALTFAPDSKVLASRGGADNSIWLYDVGKDGEPRQITLRAGNNPAQGTFIIIGGRGRGSATGPGLAFSPDGALLATPGPSQGAGNARGTLVLIDVATGKELRKVELPQAIRGLVFSPDGRVLATENNDRTITLWEVASGKERAHLGKPVVEQQPNRGMGLVFVVEGLGGNSSEPAGPVGLAFSPDGRSLAARSPDLSVRVWDVTAGKEVGQLRGHGGRVETVAFSPDGKALASGAADTTILLWDAAALTKNLTKPQSVELPDGAVKGLWDDLAGEDAARALQGVHKLAAAPRQAVPFLAERLKPAPAIDPKKIARWIEDLESGKFAVRDEAIKNLVKVDQQAVPALQKVLAESPPLETRKRVEELLDRLTHGNLTPEQLRLIRAVEALERMGTPAARELLRTLAKGAPGMLPTRQAQAALKRMKDEG